MAPPSCSTTDGRARGAINAIYGKTDVPTQSSESSAAARPTASGPDRRGQGRGPGAAPGKIRNFAIQLQPGQPTAAVRRTSPSAASCRVRSRRARSSSSPTSACTTRARSRATFRSTTFTPDYGRQRLQSHTRPIAPGQVKASARRPRVEAGVRVLGLVRPHLRDDQGSELPDPRISLHRLRQRLLRPRQVPSFATTQGLAMRRRPRRPRTVSSRTTRFPSNVAFTEVSGNPVRCSSRSSTPPERRSARRRSQPANTARRSSATSSRIAWDCSRRTASAIQFTFCRRQNAHHPLRDLRGRHHRQLIFQPAMNPAASAEDVIFLSGASPAPAAAASRRTST